MKNIFITGGLGQDGQILSKIFLFKKKYRVFILTKKSVFKKSKFKYIKYIKINLLKKKN